MMADEQRTPEGPTIRIRKWDQFQHYKERTPPWIKLHRSVLDKREWYALSGDACKLLAECWLVASEDPDGWIPLSTADLTWRLRRSDPSHMATLLQELERLDFVDLSDHDSRPPLAERTHDASTALDRGEAEGETETEDSVSNETGDKPPPDEEPPGVDLADLDAASEEDWATMRAVYLPAIRSLIWQGNKPPLNVPAKWNVTREGSIVRNWIRGGYMEPDEVVPFLETARKRCGWDGPASLSWLAGKGDIGRLRELVGEAQKAMPVRMLKVKVPHAA
jgi:hypothetical protein